MQKAKRKESSGTAIRICSRTLQPGVMDIHRVYLQLPGKHCNPLHEDRELTHANCCALREGTEKQPSHLEGIK